MAKRSSPSILKAPLKIEKLVEHARALKQRKAALDRQIDKVKEEVKEFMGDEWEEMYDAKGLRLLATWDWRSKDDVNKAILQKRYPKAFAAVYREIPYRPFELK